MKTVFCIPWHLWNVRTMIHIIMTNFDVESVKKEIERGRKLKYMLWEKTGSTVGCDLKSCFKNYHFFCAKNDHTVLQADELKGAYKVFCQQDTDPHNDLPSVNPSSGVFHSHYSERTKPRQAYFSGVKTKRKEKTSLNRQSRSATWKNGAEEGNGRQTHRCNCESCFY